MSRQHTTLERWFQIGEVLVGTCFNHPKLKDGSEVRTTRVVSQPSAILHKGDVVWTKNTRYTLGEPA
jgi:hypothetical protein